MRVQMPDGSEQDLTGGSIPVAQVLSLLGVNPVEVIVTRNGAVIPEDAIVGTDDVIRLIRVSHGG